MARKKLTLSLTASDDWIAYAAMRHALNLIRARLDAVPSWERSGRDEEVLALVDAVLAVERRMDGSMDP